MMILFSTGDDCVGKVGDARPALGDVGNFKKKNNNNGTSTSSARALSRFRDFGDDLVDIAEVFDPVEGVSSIFESTIHSLSHNYIQRYFERICSHPEKADYLHSYYIDFCKEYNKNNCIDEPK